MKLNALLKEKFDVSKFQPYTDKDLDEVRIDWDNVKKSRWFVYQSNATTVSFIELDATVSSAYQITVNVHGKMEQFKSHAVINGHQVADWLLKMAEQERLELEDASTRLAKLEVKPKQEGNQ